MIKYQDRIIYGSDLNTDGAGNVQKFRKRMHDKWFHDWKYFVSSEEMQAPAIFGTFRGLALPKEIIDKIFRVNAEKWYPGI